MTAAVGPGFGRLEGRGHVIGPDGTVKAEIILTSEGIVSREDAQRAAVALGISLTTEDHEDGSNPPPRGS